MSMVSKILAFEPVARTSLNSDENNVIGSQRVKKHSRDFRFD